MQVLYFILLIYTIGSYQQCWREDVADKLNYLHMKVEFLDSGLCLANV